MDSLVQHFTISSIHWTLDFFVQSPTRVFRREYCLSCVGPSDGLSLERERERRGSRKLISGAGYYSDETNRKTIKKPNIAAAQFPPPPPHFSRAISVSYCMKFEGIQGIFRRSKDRRWPIDCHGFFVCVTDEEKESEIVTRRFAIITKDGGPRERDERNLQPTADRL